MWIKIKEFWLNYESKLIIVFGFLLVSVISFEAGLIKGREIKEKPIIIEQNSQNSCQEATAGQEAASASNLAQEAANPPAGIKTPGNCTYVGSKNSNKYHLPTCRWAKNIKPENTVCFYGEDDAKSRGYQPDKNCIK
jgi:hypothetical protein